MRELTINNENWRKKIWNVDHLNAFYELTTLQFELFNLWITTYKHKPKWETSMLERLDFNLNFIYHLLCRFWNIGSHNYQTTIPFFSYSYIIWQYWRLRDDSHKGRNKTSSSATQETFSYQFCLLSPRTFASVTETSKKDRKSMKEKKEVLPWSFQVQIQSCLFH